MANLNLNIDAFKLLAEDMEYFHMNENKQALLSLILRFVRRKIIGLVRMIR